MTADVTALALENVLRALERNSTAGERVLIASDTGTDSAIRDLLEAAAARHGLEVDVVAPPPVDMPNAEPGEETSEALARCDLVMLVPSVPISHTLAVRRAVEHGARIMAMDGVTIDMLATGGGAADYAAMHELAVVLEELWNEAAHVRVASDLGMDLEADISGRKSWRWDGYTFSADWYDLTGCALPDGEVGVAPLEGSANGTVVWDTSVHTLGLLREPVELTVEGSWVVDVKGGDQAREFAERLASLDDQPSYYCPAEIAIGINEAARITGSMREDKKALGTVHIATGTNSDIGGTIGARTHIDGVIRRPSLWMDGRAVIENGRLLVTP
jgi:leucyl aminopeptidase (aminopeptidase T)